jgi:hypothetical protein
MANIINQYGQVKVGVRIPPLYPSFVTSGLTFSYDTYNVSSYPGTGNIFYDISGKGNNMIFNNSVAQTIGTEGGNNIDWNPNGIKNFVFNYSAFGSNGSNSYGRVPLTTTDSLGYTFGGWVQNVSGGAYTFQKGMDSVYGGWAITLSVGNNSAGLTIINASSQGVSLAGNTTLINNQWYYIVGQYIHNSGLKIYVNGNLTNSMTQGSTQISLRNSPGWTIAGIASNIIGRSVISTYHMYNRNLSDSEILQNFNSNKTRYGY